MTASSPPAEAPIPTIGKPCFVGDRSASSFVGAFDPRSARVFDLVLFFTGFLWRLSSPEFLRRVKDEGGVLLPLILIRGLDFDNFLPLCIVLTPIKAVSIRTPYCELTIRILRRRNLLNT